MKKNTQAEIARWFSIIVTGLFALILIIPPSRDWFINLSTKHPYIMGFIKFALLATVGEILALLAGSKQWQVPKGWLAKMIVWGFLGIIITLAFQIFSNGVAGAISKGYLPGKNSVFMQAFLTSLLMNGMFAPMFMPLHRITDTMINAAADGKRIGFLKAVEVVDWKGFVSFVLFRTLPIFWVPAHTISFLLPPEFRVIFAAALSMVLGVILVFASKKKN